MPTRSRTESGLRSASRFVVAVVLVATLVACAHARAPKPPDDVASVDEHATEIRQRITRQRRARRACNSKFASG